MKIEIENSLNDLDEMANLMRIVDCTKGSSNSLLRLINLIDIALPTNSLLKYGKGSNHVWVSYRNNRILLITKSLN
tara:strand:- start:224 stop:451 length:228 start_codon:yes stop_codon:yes gene_type:complete